MVSQATRGLTSEPMPGVIHGKDPALTREASRKQICRDNEGKSRTQKWSSAKFTAHVSEVREERGVETLPGSPDPLPKR